MASSSSVNFPRRRAASTSQRHASVSTPDACQKRAYMSSRPSMVLELNPHTLESCRGLADASLAAPTSLGIMHRFEQPMSSSTRKPSQRSVAIKSEKFPCSICQRKALCLCQSCASRKVCFYKKRKTQTDLIKKRDEIAHDVEEVLRAQTAVERSVLSTRESTANLRFRIDQKKRSIVEKRKTLQDVNEKLARARKNIADLQVVCRQHEKVLARCTPSKKKELDHVAKQLFDRERLMALMLVQKVFPLERQEKKEGECECVDQTHKDRRIPEQIADAARSFKDGKVLLTVVEEAVKPNIHYSISGFCVNDCGEYGVRCVPRSGSVFKSRQSSLAVHSALAALTYGVQLVTVLPFIFDSILPCHVSLRDVALCERVAEGSLGVDMAKLNVAVVYLCLNQGIDPSLIDPKRPFANLIQLCDTIASSADQSAVSRPYAITDALLQTLEGDFKKIQPAERERTQVAEDDWCVVQDRDIEMLIGDH